MEVTKQNIILVGYLTRNLEIFIKDRLDQFEDLFGKVYTEEVFGSHVVGSPNELCFDLSNTEEDSKFDYITWSQDTYHSGKFHVDLIDEDNWQKFIDEHQQIIENKNKHKKQERIERLTKTLETRKTEIAAIEKELKKEIGA